MEMEGKKREIGNHKALWVKHKEKMERLKAKVEKRAEKERNRDPHFNLDRAKEHTGIDRKGLGVGGKRKRKRKEKKDKN